MKRSYIPRAYLESPDSFYAETIRGLRAELLRHIDSGKRSLLITSSWPGEGKSTLCLNLAFSLREFYPRVLIIDSDLRKMSLTWALSSGPAPLRRIPVDGIEGICLAGAVPSPKENPALMLSQPAYIQQLRSWVEESSVVLTDSPALSVCSDALLCKEWTQSTLMVVSESRFRGNQEGHLREDLRDHKINLLGAVVISAHPTRRR